MLQERPPTTERDEESSEERWQQLWERLQEFFDAAPVAIARAVNRALKFVLRGTRIQRIMRELQPVIEEINELGEELARLDDGALRAKTDEFRRRIAQGEDLDDLLPEAFAVAREAADRRIGMWNVFKPAVFFDPEAKLKLGAAEHWRLFECQFRPEDFAQGTALDPARMKDPEHRKLFADTCQRLGAGARPADILLPPSFYDEIRALCPEYRPPFRMRPFDVQLIGGIILHEGKIAEMVTGEGKTLVATLPAYLNSLDLHAGWVAKARELQGDDPARWVLKPYAASEEGGRLVWRLVDHLPREMAKLGPGGVHHVLPVSPGVHVVTVNDYLARRDRCWNGPMFEALGLTVGAIQSEMDSVQRHPEYAADITYGTNNEFGFDYLRDNMKDRVEEQVQRTGGRRLHYGIIDEVDNILIDEARTPLIISGPAEESSDRYYIANRLVNSLTGTNAQRLPRDPIQRETVLANYDYTFNLKDHSVALSERGIKSAQKFIGVENLYQGRNMEWPPYIEAALKAKELYKLDVDYVIREGEVIIVDEFTGRLMPGRRWSDGLHQAVEAKEASRGARIKEENQTLATITFQNFFRLYDKIAGMTGTALTEALEFMKIYKLDVVPIPTNRPLRRYQYQDLIYGTEKEKWGAIVEDIAHIHQTGRPMLVGTVSIEKSEKLSALLTRRGIKHEVLNAKNHEKEAAIVALAGQFGAVTVSTNMAGRGTDILLGACPWPHVLKHWQEEGLAPRELTEALVRRELAEPGTAPGEVAEELVLKELQTRLERHWLDAWGLRKENEDEVPDAETHQRLERYWRERGMAPLTLLRTVGQDGQARVAPVEGVADLGGLHIVGTERHEARRIDNQLRGRAGRQGDPGSSRFFVCLEDDLMKIFMAEWVRRFMVRAGLSDGQPIESGMVSRSIERAQKKVEEQNFEARKHLLEYDEVMDEQRKLIYSQRQEVLEGGERRDPAEVIARALARFLAPDLRPPSEELPERLFALLEAHVEAIGAEITREEWQEATRDSLAALLAEKASAARPEGLTPGDLRAWARAVVADCRADGGRYPEQWRLDRLGRWADALGLGCTAADLAGVVRRELAGFLADAARERLADQGLDDLLSRWFTIGFEQDLPLLSRSARWELETFRDWVGRLGVSVEIVQWTPSTTTCAALLPLWLAGARKTFAGRSAADVAGELAARAAELYLASPLFLGRPDAARVASWAGRRLGLPLTPKAVEAAYGDRVAPRLVAALADHLAGLPPGQSRAQWPKSTADWHLDTHLRFAAHNLIGLATHLSGRLRLGLNSLELAKRPAAEIPGFLLEKLARRGERVERDGEHIEGLEDIAFNMMDGSVARLLEIGLGKEAATAANERSFVPLAEWAHELGLSITESQWRAFDLHELRLHFIREAAAAYPANDTPELLASFVPRFIRKAIQLFLGSETFREQPGYGGLAAWAVTRFPFLPRDVQVEAQTKRFAEDKLKEIRRQLIEAKLDEYRQSGAEIEDAVQELVPATLETHRSFVEGDEMDFAGLAAYARKVFEVSVTGEKLEEEAEGDERQAVRVLAGLAKARYARKGLETLVNHAAEAAFALCLPAEQFPSQWKCARMRDWLRAVGLGQVTAAEDIREEALADIEGYFAKEAHKGYAPRPAEAIRAEVVSAALQVFLETSLVAEGCNLVGLAHAAAKKYGIPLDPFELSKLAVDELEALLRTRIYEAYEARKAELSTRRMLWTVRQLLLQTIDVKWKDHLYNMDHLRGVIGFRGYGQQDPKVEYKREGYSMFDAMTKSMEDTVTDYLLKVEFNMGEEEARSVWRADSYIHEASESFKRQQQAAAAPQGERTAARAIASHKRPGRNDPCPCGKTRPDGKPLKYKNCCGKR